MGQRLKVAIIGLGKIGQGLDEGRSSTSYCLSHASAFASHSSFEILAGIDPNEDARKKFHARFGVEALSDLENLKSGHGKIDVVVVAGPTRNNFEIFRKALSLKPRLIILEKPMGSSLVEAREMLQMAEAASTKLAINFIRRTEPGALKMRELIRSGAIGGLQKVLVTYSKGLSNNGSHFIDLLRLNLGETSDIQILGSSEERWMDDIEPDFSLRMGGVPVFFHSLREKFYSARDIEFVGSTGAIHYLRGGAKILKFDVVESQVFEGYKFLSLDGIEIPNELNRAQYFVTEDLAQHLLNEKPLMTEASSALRVMEDIERIKALCRTN